MPSPLADPSFPFLISQKQLGTHGRGKRKREEMGDLLKRMEKKAKDARA